jgi:hypothetical protein
VQELTQQHLELQAALEKLQVLQKSPTKSPENSPTGD